MDRTGSAPGPSGQSLLYGPSFSSLDSKPIAYWLQYEPLWPSYLSADSCTDMPIFIVMTLIYGCPNIFWQRAITISAVWFAVCGHKNCTKRYTYKTVYIQSGIHNRLYRCVIFTKHVSFTNVTAGRITQSGRYAARGSRVEDLCLNVFN